ncbi:polysaccharide deacetylase family protein [Alsobacter sp. SYSU BS001988]
MTSVRHGPDRLIEAASRNAIVSLVRGLRTAGALSPEQLTVFCYHRVGSPQPDQFYGYRPNRSGSAEQFRAQMRLFKALFEPISVGDLARFVSTGERLPPYPGLVTFDDGYRDNGAEAWPILREFNIPAVIFLATEHIGGAKPFLWDFAAFCFEKTSRREAHLPLLGPIALGSLAQRRQATSAWINATKAAPAAERWGLADQLADVLDIRPPPDEFSHLYLNWDEVRALHRQGLDFGGHTASHPILSRTTPEEARTEFQSCQAALAGALGEPAASFAYPNGSSRDFGPEHEALARSSGFRVAFALHAGSSMLPAIRDRPTAVDRVYIGERDGYARLAVKLARFYAARNAAPARPLS